MAPIRRYLRITKYSVLEVLIYLDPPSATPWLLHSRDPALPRILAAARPYILPKLREERMAVRPTASSKRKAGVRDTIEQDDFEVAIYLRTQPTPHAILAKEKHFAEPGPRLRSNASKLTSWLQTGAAAGDAIDVDAPVILQEDDDDDDEFALSRIPPARTRTAVPDSDDDAEELFVSSASASPAPAAPEDEEEKKLAVHNTYTGFAIHGRVLCLCVKRRTPNAPATVSSQALMETWVSTQAVRAGGEADGAEE
ncbi:hypothetical protein EJ06DRAFT_554266 [Trichodelitschia bisporula]|uniref:Uncharacterized protein n=1 Tax=Trichodelitschia bisporula TaxID=703511 RepID=A0A6G1I3B7_9PEZI|nr:hypothetical protein EJ06DRAFT_554266 [Trichodelitschia bisporula]